MLKMVVLRTELTEEELFLKLVFRGRHADIPYYFSVESHNWGKGVVVFTRLDCEPTTSFKVGVTGRDLVVSKTFQQEAESWLKEWGVPFKIAQEKEVGSPEEARNFLRKLRDAAPSAKKRKAAGVRVRRAIIQFNRAIDKEILSRP